MTECTPFTTRVSNVSVNVSLYFALKTRVFVMAMKMSIMLHNHDTYPY